MQSSETLVTGLFSTGSTYQGLYSPYIQIEIELEILVS